MASTRTAGVRADDTSSKSGRDPGAFLRYFKQPTSWRGAAKGSAVSKRGDGTRTRDLRRDR
jgi:hypothetical protein